MMVNPPYEPRDYRRTCTYCAGVFLRSKLTEQDNALLCSGCLDRHGPITKDKMAANAPKPIVRGVRDAAPLVPLPLLQVEEGRLLAFLSDRVVDGYRYATTLNTDVPIAATPQSPSLGMLAWAGVYFYGLANDANVSTDWQAKASANLQAIMDTWLVPHQRATVTGSVLSGSISVETNATLDTVEHAVAGLSALYAYRQFGTPSYLTCAKGIATYLRHTQCGDKCVVPFSGGGVGIETQAVSDGASGTSPWHSGALWYVLTNPVGDPSPLWRFYPNQLLALWFWKELQSTAGDITVGDASATVDFNASAAAPLSTCQSELRTFWRDGVGGVVGFSSASMRGYFDPWTSAGGSNAWVFDTTPTNADNSVHGITVAQSLRGLYEYEGYSSQVADVYTYVRGFTSNSTLEPNTDEYSDAYTAPNDVAVGGLGTYYPKVCFASHLSTMNENNGTPGLCWATAGLIAPINLVQDSASLQAARVAHQTVTEQDMAFDGDFVAQESNKPYFVPLNLRARCGLNYQQAFIFDDETLYPQDRQISATMPSTAQPLGYVDEAAMAGLLYRYLPVKGQVY